MSLILKAVHVHPRHAGLGGERNKVSFAGSQLAATQAVLFLGQNYNRTALGRFIRQRRQLGRICQIRVRYAREGMKRDA